MSEIFLVLGAAAALAYLEHVAMSSAQAYNDREAERIIRRLDAEYIANPSVSYGELGEDAKIGLREFNNLNVDGRYTPNVPFHLSQTMQRWRVESRRQPFKILQP